MGKVGEWRVRLREFIWKDPWGRAEPGGISETMMMNNGILFMGGLGGPKVVTVPCPPPHPKQTPLKGSWPFIIPEC